MKFVACRKGEKFSCIALKNKRKRREKGKKERKKEESRQQISIQNSSSLKSPPFLPRKKMKVLSYFSLFFLVLLLQKTSGERNEKEKEKENETVLNRITFGSCNYQDHPQTIWPTISSQKGDIWIWLGDVVYADVKYFHFFFPATPPRLQSLYDSLKSNSLYQEFIKKIRVLGVWDDHDFGHNDGGKSYLYKEESQKIFLDFLDEPESSPRRNRPGIYDAYEFGPEGKKVSVILLDVRFFREDHEILGETQWQWLQEKISNSILSSQVVLIGSGSQILPASKPFSEKFPIANRRRLLHIIQTSLSDLYFSNTTQKSLPIVQLLSGDVHYGESLSINCPIAKPPSQHSTTSTIIPTIPIPELTSSGLTHSLCYHMPPFLAELVVSLLNTHHRKDDKVYKRENFGVIDIHWEREPLSLSAQLRDQKGNLVFEDVVESVPFPTDGEKRLFLPLSKEEAVLCSPEETEMPLLARTRVQSIRNVFYVILILCGFKIAQVIRRKVKKTTEKKEEEKKEENPTVKREEE